MRIEEDLKLDYSDDEVNYFLYNAEEILRSGSGIMLSCSPESSVQFGAGNRFLGTEPYA